MRADKEQMILQEKIFDDFRYRVNFRIGYIMNPVKPESVSMEKLSVFLVNLTYGESECFNHYSTGL